MVVISLGKNLLLKSVLGHCATFARPPYVSHYDFDIFRGLFRQVSYLDIEIPDVFEIPLVWL